MPFNAVATEHKVEVDLSAIKEVGQYEVTATLFGTTRLGREIQVSLPVKSFNIFPVLATPPSAASVASEASAAIPSQSNSRKRRAAAGWFGCWVALAYYCCFCSAAWASSCCKSGGR